MAENILMRNMKVAESDIQTAIKKVDEEMWRLQGKREGLMQALQCVQSGLKPLENEGE